MPPDAASAARLQRMRHAVAQHAVASHVPIKQQAPPMPRPPGHLPPIAQILRGDWHETALGPVFIRDDWYPLDHAHGTLPLSAPLSVSNEALSYLLGAAAPDPARLAFFDIETTGLSGGTGTYIVLAGLGSYEDGAFRMRQYFLADIASEQAMLTMLAADLARFDGIVTYNGRAFDVPFVETRLTLARIASPCDGMPHFDLLHPVRRLYKHRMPACRLADAERRLLRIDRPDDVPGWQIPQLYFDYVRAGRASPLRGVFRHNAEDVLSLVGVLATLAGLLSDDAALDPDDAAAAGRWWEAAANPERARSLYAYALPWLDGGPDWAWAAGRHARLSARAGDREEAARLWAALWRRGDRAAGLALAKHHEHRSRDLDAALAVTCGLLPAAVGAEAAALALRRARVERKLARRYGVVGQKLRTA